MKTKIIIIAFFLGCILLSSCANLKYLPNPDEIDTNEYGSYIDVTKNKGSDVKGELIAIDSLNVVVLTNTKYSKEAVRIPMKEVYGFSIRYAQTTHYGWSIPIFTLFTATHGVFILLTGPVNLISTILVTTSGENAYKFKDSDLNFNDFKMYARFPQGIPPNIDISTIK